MIENLKTLVSYNSILDNDKLPFGSKNIEVLELALYLNKNLDYCKIFI